MLDDVHTTGTNTQKVNFAQIFIFLKSIPHICGSQNVPFVYVHHVKFFFEYNMHKTKNFCYYHFLRYNIGYPAILQKSVTHIS